MANLSTIDICREDLFTPKEELEERYTAVIVARIILIREEYN